MSEFAKTNRGENNSWMDTEPLTPPFDTLTVKPTDSNIDNPYLQKRVIGQENAPMTAKGIEAEKRQHAISGMMKEILEDDLSDIEIATLPHETDLDKMLVLACNVRNIELGYDENTSPEKRKNMETARNILATEIPKIMAQKEYTNNSKAQDMNALDILACLKNDHELLSKCNFYDQTEEKRAAKACEVLLKNMQNEMSKRHQVIVMQSFENLPPDQYI